MSWVAVEWSIIGPAVVAGLLVLSTHVPLGQVVLQRGIIFIDLAIAQVAGAGVIAASAFGWEQNPWLVQIAAVGAALVAATAMNWTEKRWPRTQEALIGTLFVLAATGSILLLAENPHAGEHLKELLVGQILWTTWYMLGMIALLYAVLLVLWFGFRERLGTIGFYGVFAFAVTASVQVVGVYLVFASLILPALATRRLKGPKRLWFGYGIGAVSYFSGIVASSIFDLPTGAVAVWAMAAVALAAGFWIGHRHTAAVQVPATGPD
ncbi:metal ABC transporter permease [Elongatibacter sediminis]|uniref:Metal ABC transporter permease n=1 Tax=Elongatibacter sediminis TaxID=3119006 RepID=A0AAW9RG21_9GAMM